MATPIRSLPPGGPRRRLPGRRVVLVSLGALAALNLLILAAHTGGQGQDNPGPPLPHEIERLTPEPGAVIRPQEDVGADLLDTYTGVLIVDDHRLPEDQLNYRTPLGIVTFRPGPDKDVRSLSPGHHSATVLYWPQDKDESVARSFTWQFTAG